MDPKWPDAFPFKPEFFERYDEQEDTVFYVSGAGLCGAWTNTSGGEESVPNIYGAGVCVAQV